MIVRCLKYLSFGSLLLVIAVLVASSFVLKEYGVEYAVDNVYHSPYFIALWALMLLSGLAYVCGSSMRKLSAAFLLHISFGVVLAGAFLTYLTADNGDLFLVRDAPPSSMYTSASGELMKLGFRMQLEEFEIVREGGSDAPCDYRAVLTVTDRKRNSERVQISMNNIYTRGAYRVFLMGYDEYGVSLHVSHDPYGLPETYAGYVMLLLSAVCIFVDRKSGFRSLLARFRSGAAAVDGEGSARGGLRVLRLLAVVVFATITVFGLYRWAAAGLFPASNGFEALMLLAWFLLLLSLLLRRNMPALMLCGVLLALVMLVVALITPGGMSAPVLPVLRTPLLGLHVAVIIFSYSLLVLLAVNASVALYFHYVRGDEARVERLAFLGRLLLYPAAMLLMVGIFIGAVWANVSWGRYWGWDPKEVWALVTLLLCSLPFHGRSIALFGRPVVFHLFCLVAFMAMLFTYFGVNYLLGGVHSYL